MNPTLITAFLRQRMTSPIRLVFLFASAAFPLMFVAVAPATGFASLQGSFFFALIFGAGMIGQDTASGVLQLLFARPVRRDVYALSRWFAASLAAATVAVLQVGIAALIMTSRGAAPTMAAVGIAWGNHVTSAFGATAPLLLFSALVPGLGDLGLLVLLYLTSSIVQSVGGMMHAGALANVAQIVHDSLDPTIDFARVVGSSTSWYQIVAYLSTVTLSLALAIIVMNRKELSYASG